MTAGFGLERLGLLSLRFPRTVLLIILCLAPVFVFGLTELKFSSDVREIFRSDSPEFAKLEEVTRQYPSSGRDVLIVLEAPELFTPSTLEAVRSLHLELSLAPGVSYVLSMFSARQPPDKDGNAAAVVPPDLEAISDTSALKRELQAHPLVANKLLSSDGGLSLIVVALEGSEQSISDIKSVLVEIEHTSREILESTDVSFGLTGLAVMRVEIVDALIRDQRTFALAGLAIGLALTWFFFRSLSYVLIAGLPAVVASTWLLGGMGLMGREITVLTNVVPALVMVIVFADALHLLFAIRRNLRSGRDIEASIAQAVKRVGPACVLTSLTTTLAFLSLMLVAHPFVVGFGATAALGTAIAYAATMLTLPAVSRLLLGRVSPSAQPADQKRSFDRAIDQVCGSAATIMIARPKTVFATGVLLTVVAALLHAANEPKYQYRENLPQNNPASEAIGKIDSRLAGTSTVRLLLQWPADRRPDVQEILDVVGEAHQALQAEPLLKDVWSLKGVEDWFIAGGADRSQLFHFLEKVKSPLSTRVVSPDNNSALLTGYFPDRDASILIPVLNRLQASVDKLRRRHPDVEMSLTGIIPLSARASYEMIAQLGQSLLVAVGLIILLIGVSLRSLKAGLLSILPNVLPIAFGGACLYLFGSGLQFTSVIAFTIGFGIAVDSTIHVLNRYRLARQSGSDNWTAMAETIKVIGPVLIVTTIVLAGGFGATMVSELPMVRLYGQLSVVLLAAALAGDLLFLPASIGLMEAWLERRKRDRSLASPEAVPNPEPVAPPK